MNIFISTMGRMTLCHVKGVACSDNPQGIVADSALLPSPQLSGAFHHLSAHCFRLAAHNFNVLINSHNSY